MNTETVTAISEYIRSNQSTPFSWGEFDCCVFASHIIKLQTNIDLYAEYKGTYDSEMSAAKSQIRIGTIESQMDKHFERINPSLAQRGDIHMLEDGVMGVQFNGVWATSSNGVSLTKTNLNLCWRIK